MSERRALHYCLKVRDRKRSVDFFTKMLGMKVLRHEEFEGACKATCNGPYNSNWSKTMVGYGDEEDNFVLELTYTYGVESYEHGNGFDGITLSLPENYGPFANKNIPRKPEQPYHIVFGSPCGYTVNVKFHTDQSLIPVVSHFTLNCTNLEKSLEFWTDYAKMEQQETADDGDGGKKATLGFGPTQGKLVLVEVTHEINHGTAFGRTALGCPEAQLPQIQALMDENNQKVLTPLVSLDTPGKATVQVVICADPDGHEVAFVGDEGFRELSKMDPNGGDLLEASANANNGI